MKLTSSKCVTASIFLSILFFSISGCKKDGSEEFTVIKGNFTESFIETGYLAAKNALAVPMSRMDYRYGYRFKIVDMEKNGSYVDQGDTLLKLDDAPIQKFIISTSEGLEKEKAAAEKLKIEFQNSIQDLEAQLKSELANLNLKKVELKRAEYETVQKKKVKLLQYEQAEIKIDKLRRQLKMKPKLNECDKRIQDIKIKQKEAELESSISALDKMIITSPAKGLFQVGKNDYIYPPIDLKIGDEVRQGKLLAKIPDVTKMIVNTSVNETDFTKIKIGTAVRVRLDAAPKKPYDAEITYVARSCITREKEKIFVVVVELKDSDLSLKPGMTVSCEFVCYEHENELFVPNECLLKEDGKSYIYFDKGSSPKKIEVQSGRSNSNHTIVSGDIKPGQALVSIESILKPTSL